MWDRVVVPYTIFSSMKTRNVARVFIGFSLDRRVFNISRVESGPVRRFSKLHGSDRVGWGLIESGWVG